MNLNNNPLEPKLILGFDFGTKYIGVAVGQTTTNTARPIACLKNHQQQINWEAIDILIHSWKPQELIVGIPTDLNNKIQPITIKSLRFYQQLKKRFKLPTHKVNEQLSTWEAKKLLKLQHKEHLAKQELLDINAQAAAILVSQWLNENY